MIGEKAAILCKWYYFDDTRHTNGISIHRFSILFSTRLLLCVRCSHSTHQNVDWIFGRKKTSFLFSVSRRYNKIVLDQRAWHNTINFLSQSTGWKERSEHFLCVIWWSSDFNNFQSDDLKISQLRTKPFIPLASRFNFLPPTHWSRPNLLLPPPPPNSLPHKLLAA